MSPAEASDGTLIEISGSKYSHLQMVLELDHVVPATLTFCILETQFLKPSGHHKVQVAGCLFLFKVHDC
jgi:hypothetical protein